MTVLHDLIENDYGIKGSGRWFSSEEHSSLVYDAEKDMFYWNSRDIKGNALDYLTKIRGMDLKSAKEFINGFFGTPKDQDKSFPTYVPYPKLVDALWMNGIGNRKYWYDRKLKDETIDRRRLGYYEGWNLIPLEVDGKFANFQMRRDEPEKKIKLWYRLDWWKPILINHEMLQLVDTIYITEGPVDAFLLTQEGIPAVSHTGGAGYWDSAWFPHFHRIKKIYYICDNDRVGREAGRKVAKNLGYDRVFLYNFVDKPEKYDSGDYFKDGGTPKEFREMVEKDSKNIYEIGAMNDNRSRH